MQLWRKYSTSFFNCQENNQKKAFVFTIVTMLIFCSISAIKVEKRLYYDILTSCLFERCRIRYNSVGDHYMRKVWIFLKKFYEGLCCRFPWLKNLVLYGIFGLSAAVLDYSIFFVLTRFEIIAPEIASLSGNIVGFLFTFFCNTFFNFKKHTHILFRFISYLSITIGGMTLSTLLIHYAKNAMNVYILKAVLVLFVIPVIQFILNKKITYRDFDD